MAFKRTYKVNAVHLEDEHAMCLKSFHSANKIEQSLTF